MDPEPEEPPEPIVINEIVEVEVIEYVTVKRQVPVIVEEELEPEEKPPKPRKKQIGLHFLTGGMVLCVLVYIMMRLIAKIR